MKSVIYGSQKGTFSDLKSVPFWIKIGTEQYQNRLFYCVFGGSWVFHARAWKFNSQQNYDVPKGSENDRNLLNYNVLATLQRRLVHDFSVFPSASECPEHWKTQRFRRFLDALGHLQRPDLWFIAFSYIIDLKGPSKLYLRACYIM